MFTNTSIIFQKRKSGTRLVEKGATEKFPLANVSATDFCLCVEMGVKGIAMSLIYGKLLSKIVLLVSEMSRDKLFHAGNAHTSFSLSKFSKFLLPFLVVEVLRWV